MSIRINLEIGHEASLRTKRTPEGFTHDWEVFVRGSDKADIHTYVEKVVFNLHETFPRPKRIIKDPPYSVKESGYAGFTFPIDIYLKNRDEPKIITFDYDLQLQPSGPSISNVQKEKYVFSSVPDDFKHKLLKGGGIIVSLSAQDSAQETRVSEEKNQLYNKPNFGSSSDSGKKHKGGSKGPQSQLPNEPRPSSDFVDLFGDLIFKTNQTTAAGDSSKGLEAAKTEKIDKDGGGRSNKEKISDKDKSKSKSSPSIIKDRDKDKSTKPDKPTISDQTDRNKKDDKRSNKDRVREKQRDRSKEEKPSANASNSKRDKSPNRPKSTSPLAKRSFSPKRHTVTPSPSPKRPPSPIAAPKQHRDKSEKRSNDGKDSAKDKDRKRDRKDKRDKEHKENKHKEHRAKDAALRKDPAVAVKVDRKDKPSRDKDKEIAERITQQTPPVLDKTRGEKTQEQPSSSKVEQMVAEKPSKHKHKKKDKEKKQRSGGAKTDREEKKESGRESRKDKKEKTNKLSIDQFIAEPKVNSFSRSPKNTDDAAVKGRSKSVVDDDSSNSSLGDLTDDRFSRDKSVEKLADIKIEKQATIPLEPAKKSKPQLDTTLPQRKDKPQKPKKEKRPQQTPTLPTDQQTDDDNADSNSNKKNKKRKVAEPSKPNHKTDLTNDSSDIDLNKSDGVSETNEPPEKMAREEPIKDSSNGKTLNNKKETFVAKEEITDDAEDYLKILRELQTKIMSLQDNMELQRVVQLIAETGRYEVSDRTFDFDLCLLDRSTVRQLQEFFANLAT